MDRCVTDCIRSVSNYRSTYNFDDLFIYSLYKRARRKSVVSVEEKLVHTHI